MKFPKIPARAEHLIEFFEDGLHTLGAICERSWHDRMEVLAEGDAARLWRSDDDLFSGELYFRDAGSQGLDNAENEIFPGCPLTFRLAETLWRRHLAYSRVCLCMDIGVKAPSNDVADKLWQAQFGLHADWRAAPFANVHGTIGWKCWRKVMPRVSGAATMICSPANYISAMLVHKVWITPSLIGSLALSAANWPRNSPKSRSDNSSFSAGN